MTREAIAKIIHPYAWNDDWWARLHPNRRPQAQQVAQETALASVDRLVKAGFIELEEGR